MKFSTLFLVAFASFTLAAPTQLDDAPELNGLDAWMANQYQISLRRIDESMSQPGAAPGAVVAAPSKRDPDYYYFWVRDGSLTLDYIHHLLLTGNNPSQRERQLQDYSDLSRKLQTTSNPSGEADGNGIGEPKFNMDGTAFTGSWGRPQDDGPAIRGFVLARYANYLLKKGQDVNNLYRRELPARSVIKADLEYVSHKWRQTSFDIWEEVKGIHFYTRLVQRRAMVEGAALARRLGDAGAADHYERQAREMQAQMERFWDARRRLLVTTIDRDGGLDYKQSQIDVQVVLGALHAASDDEFYSPTGDRVQATAARVIEAFRDLYNINKARRDLAPAIGRYPEDRYSGTDVSVAHAWVLATAGIGEMYYRAAAEYKKSGRAPITANNVDFIGFAVRNQVKLSAGEMIRADDERFPTLINALIKEGDLYMARIRYHTAADGNLHEQMHRDTGYMTGATHLTWSYVAFSTAHDARQQAIKLLKA